MPADFPAWGRVYAFFRRWREHGLISEFHDRLCGRVREREGREAEPTEGVIDAQPVRAAATGPAASRGYDGGKKVPGRKRHIVTDCLGLLLVVAVTAANIGDRDAAAGLLGRACWGGPAGAGLLGRACWGGCAARTATSSSSGPTAATPAASSTGAGTNSLRPCRSSSAPTT
ncbi:transposase [Streptomyces sp. NPDC020801]|uniref:transposase n=1 Tax=Streptomyces sp. NPDC020801 TaxID=3365093 RepID=UPI0037958F30